MLLSHAGCMGMLQPLVELILHFHGVSSLYELLICADSCPFTAPSSNGSYGRGEVLSLDANRLCSVFTHKTPSARQDGCSILEESGKGFTFKFVVV